MIGEIKITVPLSYDIRSNKKLLKFTIWILKTYSDSAIEVNEIRWQNKADNCSEQIEWLGFQSIRNDWQ